MAVDVIVAIAVEKSKKMHHKSCIQAGKNFEKF